MSYLISFKVKIKATDHQNWRTRSARNMAQLPLFTCSWKFVVCRRALRKRRRASKPQYIGNKKMSEDLNTEEEDSVCCSHHSSCAETWFVFLLLFIYIGLRCDGRNSFPLQNPRMVWLDGMDLKKSPNLTDDNTSLTSLLCDIY